MTTSLNLWQDYKILQAGFKMKKEAWGPYTLCRPDPQILWPCRDEKNLFLADAVYKRSSEGGGAWTFNKKLPEFWWIKWQDLKFKVRPTDFKHTGLFPEQAAHWLWMRKLLETQIGPVKVLNLFGYTGAATAVLAKAGAEVTHVDSSKGMVAWCKENVEANTGPNSTVRYIVDDCSKFVKKELRRGQRYHALLMDPPSFGRGKSGETWKMEKHLWPLIENCAQLLKKQPLFWIINSYTAGLSALVLKNLLSRALKGIKGKIEPGELVLPIEADNAVLPCGVFARFSLDNS
jgi:23S rRNA (cytosine1962-C5)-methyltransferase